MDPGSTAIIICNPKLVENITTSNKTLELQTNGGVLFTNQTATVPGFGKVWYDTTAITNILSLALLEKKYWVTYDSTGESVFIVYLPNTTVRFDRKKGDYTFTNQITTQNHQAI
jgi:hypothetical protein